MSTSTGKISQIFMHRVDNTRDLGELQEELLVLERIERDSQDEKVKEEMYLKILYLKGRIAELFKQLSNGKRYKII